MYTQLAVTTSNTTNSSVSATTGVAVSAGELLIAYIAADNNGTNGASSLTGVADSSGNVWSLVATANQSSGVARDGVTIALYQCRVSTALADTATVTASFSPDTRSKVLVLAKVANTGGAYGAATQSGDGTTVTAATLDVAHANDIVLGFTGCEGNISGSGDSDSTNGSWSAQSTNTANTGSFITSIYLSRQTKTATATGTQSYQVANFGGGRGWASMIVAFGPYVSAEVATGTGSAHDASILTGNPVTAGTASGTGSALDATVKISVSPETAYGTGTAHDLSAKVAVSAETAEGTGSAHNASMDQGSAAQVRVGGNWAIAPIFVRSGGEWVKVKAKIRSGGQWVEV